jgi:hypothetical protein
LVWIRQPHRKAVADRRGWLDRFHVLPLMHCRVRLKPQCGNSAWLMPSACESDRLFGDAAVPTPFRLLA